MFEVEKNIPVPNARRQYPWRRMEVGDSFFLSGDFPAAKRSVIACSAASFGKRSGKKFITRRVEGGLRVWRVE